MYFGQWLPTLSYKTLTYFKLIWSYFTSYDTYDYHFFFNLFLIVRVGYYVLIISNLSLNVLLVLRNLKTCPSLIIMWKKGTSNFFRSFPIQLLDSTQFLVGRQRSITWLEYRIKPSTPLCKFNTYVSVYYIQFNVSNNTGRSRNNWFTGDV